MPPTDENGYPRIVVPDLGRIFQAIRDKNCIPFFGAGASTAYTFNGVSKPGIPNGKELTLSLLQEAGKATPAQISTLNDPTNADSAALRDVLDLRSYDLIKAADSFLYSRANNRGQLDRFLRQQVAKAQDQPRPIHTVVAQLQEVLTVLTTNYDCLFETACRTFGRELFKHVHDQNNPRSGHWDPLPADPLPPQIILHKMHGSHELDKTMVVTRANYIRYLATWRDEDRGMPGIFAQRIPDSTVLFLGYGLADWDLLTIWEGIVSSLPQNGEESTSFAIMTNVSNEDREYLQYRRITVIECDLTEFAIALAREFKLQIPELGIPVPKAGNGGLP